MVLRDLMSATGHLRSPNILQTSTCCMLLEIIISRGLGNQPVAKKCLSIIFSSIFVDYEDYLSSSESLLQSCPDSNTIFGVPVGPLFANLRPFFDEKIIENNSSQQDQKQSADEAWEDATGSKASDEEIDAMNIDELRTYTKQLLKEYKSSQRQVLKHHFKSWSRILKNDKQVESWGDILKGAKTRVVVAKYFSIWKKKFDNRMSIKQEISKIPARASVGGASTNMDEMTSLPTTADIGVIDTSEGWGQLATWTTIEKQPSEVKETHQDALGGSGTLDVEKIDTVEFLASWIDTIVTAVTGKHCKISSFTKSFADGTLMLKVALAASPKSIVNVKTLDEYFEKDSPPTVLFSSSDLRSKPMLFLCLSALFDRWLATCRTLVDDDPHNRLVNGFCGFSDIRRLSVSSPAWTMIAENNRLEIINMLLDARTKVIYPSFLAPMRQHNQGSLKKLLSSPMVRSVVNNVTVSRLLRSVFSRGAQGDDEITLFEFRSLLQELRWFMTVITNEDMHLIFHLSQAGGCESGDADAQGFDGDGTIDIGEFYDAFCILSAFFTDTDETSEPPEEHITWFFKTVFLPTVQDNLSIL